MQCLVPTFIANVTMSLQRKNTVVLSSACQLTVAPPSSEQLPTNSAVSSKQRSFTGPLCAWKRRTCQSNMAELFHCLLQTQAAPLQLGFDNGFGRNYVLA